MALATPVSGHVPDYLDAWVFANIGGSDHIQEPAPQRHYKTLVRVAEARLDAATIPLPPQFAFYTLALELSHRECSSCFGATAELLVGTFGPSTNPGGSNIDVELEATITNRLSGLLPPGDIEVRVWLSGNAKLDRDLLPQAGELTSNVTAQLVTLTRSG